MIAHHIAEQLLKEDLRSCQICINPPWVEDADDGLVKQAWCQVRTLIRQRDGLIELLPQYKSEYESQFNDLVLCLAKDLYWDLAR